MNVRWTRTVAGALLGVGLAACEPAAPVAPEPPTEPLGPGIHPTLVVASQTGDSAVVELHLRRVQIPDEVASYQGELRYDAARLKLSAAAFPAGAAGVWNEVEPGRLRFAGAAPEGVRDGAVLALRFARSGAVEAAGFSVAMEEVVARNAFAPLTSRVVARPHPYVLAHPIPAP